MAFKSGVTGKRPVPTSNSNNQLGQTSATSGKTDMTGKEGKGMYQGRDNGRRAIKNEGPSNPKGDITDKGSHGFKPFY